MAWGRSGHKEPGGQKEVSGVLWGWRSCEQGVQGRDRDDHKKTSLFPSMGWQEWIPDPIHPNPKGWTAIPLHFGVQRCSLPLKTCWLNAKHPLGMPCILPPSPEARATFTHTPLTPLPSSLFSLCSLGPGPTLCNPLLPATGSPYGFSFLETLPFSGLRALPGQGPRAGLCPGHWKVWDIVQTQPPGGLVAPWLHL